MSPGTTRNKMSAGSCCAQILWIKQQLQDYRLKFDHVPIKCDNTSAINISKNPIQHSRTKHIEIRHHFLRDHVQKVSRPPTEYITGMVEETQPFTISLIQDRTNQGHNIHTDIKNNNHFNLQVSS